MATTTTTTDTKYTTSRAVNSSTKTTTFWIIGALIVLAVILFATTRTRDADTNATTAITSERAVTEPVSANPSEVNAAGMGTTDNSENKTGVDAKIDDRNVGSAPRDEAAPEASK